MSGIDLPHGGMGPAARRRPRWPRRFRIQRSRYLLFRRLSYIVGAVVAGSGVAMLPAALVSVIYREWSHAVGICAASAITVGLGFAAWRLFGQRGRITTREGFAAVGLSWIVMSAFGALPYLLTGSITSVTDAFFEAAAGFTTTGSSILIDPADLSHGILIWRAGTQWFGGMVVIVLSIAVLPLLGVGGVELALVRNLPDRNPTV